jgi:hypothetical protein
VIHNENTFPVDAPITIRTTHKLPHEIWPIIVEQSQVKTYRELADEYEVSYEAIRRVLNAASSR